MTTFIEILNLLYEFRFDITVTSDPGIKSRKASFFVEDDHGDLSFYLKF